MKDKMGLRKGNINILRGNANVWNTMLGVHWAANKIIKRTRRSGTTTQIYTEDETILYKVQLALTVVESRLIPYSKFFQASSTDQGMVSCIDDGIRSHVS